MKSLMRCGFSEGAFHPYDGVEWNLVNLTGCQSVPKQASNTRKSLDVIVLLVGAVCGLIFAGCVQWGLINRGDRMKSLMRCGFSEGACHPYDGVEWNLVNLTGCQSVPKQASNTRKSLDVIVLLVGALCGLIFAGCVQWGLINRGDRMKSLMRCGFSEGAFHPYDGVEWNLVNLTGCQSVPKQASNTRKSLDVIVLLVGAVCGLIFAGCAQWGLINRGDRMKSLMRCGFSEGAFHPYDGVEWNLVNLTGCQSVPKQASNTRKSLDVIVLLVGALCGLIFAGCAQWGLINRGDRMKSLMRCGFSEGAFHPYDGVEWNLVNLTGCQSVPKQASNTRKSLDVIVLLVGALCGLIFAGCVQWGLINRGDRMKSLMRCGFSEGAFHPYDAVEWNLVNLTGCQSVPKQASNTRKSLDVVVLLVGALCGLIFAGCARWGLINCGDRMKSSMRCGFSEGAFHPYDGVEWNLVNLTGCQSVKKQASIARKSLDVIVLLVGALCGLIFAGCVQWGLINRGDRMKSLMRCGFSEGAFHPYDGV